MTTPQDELSAEERYMAEARETLNEEMSIKCEATMRQQIGDLIDAGILRVEMTEMCMNVQERMSSSDFILGVTQGVRVVCNELDRVQELMRENERRDARIKELEAQVGEARKVMEVYASTDGEDSQLGVLTHEADEDYVNLVEIGPGDEMVPIGHEARAYLARWHGGEK
jgi:hypothetical protein